MVDWRSPSLAMCRGGEVRYTCTGPGGWGSQRYTNFPTRVTLRIRNAPRGSMTFDTCQTPKTNPSQLDRLFFGRPR